MEAALEGAQEIGFTVLSISHFADGRIYSDFADGRDRRALVPGVCRHAIGGDSRLAGDISHRDSHDVFAPAQAPVRGRPWAALSSQRKSVQRNAEGIRAQLEMGAAALRHWYFGVLLLTIALNLYLLAIVPKGFFPQEDTGRLNGGIQAEQDISFQAMRSRIARFVEIIKSDPGVDNIMAFTGAGTGNTTNTGFVFWFPEASQSARCQRRRNRQSPAPETGGGTRSDALFASHARSHRRRQAHQRAISIHDSKRHAGGLDASGDRFYCSKCDKLPGLTDVNTDQQNSGLEARLYMTVKPPLEWASARSCSTTLCMTPLDSARYRPWIRS